jgi:hypothetical protein
MAARTTGAPLFAQLQRTLEEDALYAELRAPLPYHLTRAQVEARGEYLADLDGCEKRIAAAHPWHTTECAWRLTVGSATLPLREAALRQSR